MPVTDKRFHLRGFSAKFLVYLKLAAESKNVPPQAAGRKKDDVLYFFYEGKSSCCPLS